MAYQYITRTIDLSNLSDALPFSGHHNAKIGKESADLNMLDSCPKNINTTSAAMARQNAESAGPPQLRTPCGEEMMRLFEED